MPSRLGFVLPTWEPVLPQFSGRGQRRSWLPARCMPGRLLAYHAVCAGRIYRLESDIGRIYRSESEIQCFGENLLRSFQYLLSDFPQLAPPGDHPLTFFGWLYPSFSEAVQVHPPNDHEKLLREIALQNWNRCFYHATPEVIFAPVSEESDDDREFDADQEIHESIIPDVVGREQLLMGGLFAGKTIIFGD